MKSIFVSRVLESKVQLKQLLGGDDRIIIDMPLINIVRIPFSHTPQTNWIFFSSKNAIKFFFDQNPLPAPGVKYAVISRSSEIVLNAYGIQASFVGDGVDITKIAKEFRHVLGNDSVLFPQAMDSLQTVQKHLAFTNTTYNLYTYKTILKTDFNLPYTDVLIFTSPSNVKAYFSKYKIDSRQLVIAMGTSTKYKLSDYGIKDVLVPREFSEKGLFDLLSTENYGIVR